MRKWLGLWICLCMVLCVYIPGQAVHVHAASKTEVAVDVLNVREGPADVHTIIGQVTEGETFTVLNERHGWLKIRFDGSGTGWIAGQYTMNKDEQKEKDTTKKTRPLISNDSANRTVSDVTLLYDGTNVRSGPGLNYSVLARGNKGDRLAVLDKIKDWYKVQLSDGSSGFIAGWIVISAHERKNVLRGKTIVLDPGHGGADSGAVGADDGTPEKSLSLRTARSLAEKMRDQGADVILTRDEDEYISLEERVKSAEAYRADAFISIHYNASRYPQASGVTSYYYTKRNDRPLAAAIQEMLGEETDRRDRGVRFADYHVLRENSQPAALLELGFLTNPWEEHVVRTSSYQDHVTTAIIDGVKNYFQEKQ